MEMHQRCKSFAHFLLHVNLFPKELRQQCHFSPSSIGIQVQNVQYLHTSYFALHSLVLSVHC